ncbi:MAG: sulfite exporter TauE/SafE family protein [Rhodobacteraceae bacterium]|jgi:uncharacterized membrane protein YfcA|nr:sulfite exporter TauE/SafE family protein [Paracoccaceae bacterium]
MDFNYSEWQIAAVLATYLFAAVAKGVTGLGFSTTCLPFLAVIVGLKEALPLLIIPSISSNLIVMRAAGRFQETLHRFWPMLLATIPGLVLGLWTLDRVDGAWAAAVLGAVLLLWCIFALAKPDLRLADRWERPLGPVSGFLTGVLNGVTGSQVMPSMPYLMALHLDRNMFIQAINLSFTMSSLIMAIGLQRLGLFTPDALLVSIAGTLVVAVGVTIGTRIGKALAPGPFRLAVLVILMVMGLSLVARVI